MKSIVKISVSLLAGTLIITSCFKNPVTGRKSLNLVPESEMRATSQQQYMAFLSENRPSTGTADAEMVRRVGLRMSKAVQEYLAARKQADLVSGYSWEFNLVNSNEANAWCMPGGKVVVYTGILPLTQNEAGLAVVMGHEIAHAVARHGNERMSQQLAVQGLSAGLSAALSSQPAKTQQVWSTVFGVSSQLGVLKYSRTHESEADKMGLHFMALAGYNPTEAVIFWSRMAAQGGQKPPQIVSTHPSDATRIADIKAELPAAMKDYRPQ